MSETLPVRISVVSYLNSKPFIYGLRNAKFNVDVDIQEDTPSLCAEKLLSGRADIGLVPVSVLPLLKKHSVISDYCIGSDGNVNSVLLLSNVPLEKIKTILLDYQSRTSVLLTRVLANKFWYINPKWQSTSAEFEKQIVADCAGLVIGDRALMLKNEFRFVYDLSAEWKKFTGLPFVFACWSSIRDLEKSFLNDFNSALKNGISLIDEISKKEITTVLNEHEIKHYLTDCIDYNFDDKKKNAMNIFLKMTEDIV